MADTDSVGEFAGEAAHGFLKSFLKEKKSQLEAFFIKNNFGFVPSGMDFSDYKKLQKKNSFKQLQFLIGKNHPTLGIILLGMHIASMSHEQRKKCVDEHRQQVYDKYKGRGVSVLNMALTGFIDGYIKWLGDLYVEKNPSEKELIDIYEKILDQWNEITIFVQTSKADHTIQSRLVHKMSASMAFIYVFASESAISKWQKILDKITKDNLLTEFDYDISSHNLLDSEYEKVWIFEHVAHKP